MNVDERAEWLEPDGLGGFASGTATGIRTRRYHAVLLAATQPPTGRMALVNGLDVWVETPAGRFPLSSQRYLPDLIHPDGAERLVSFDTDPWPQWTYELEDGTRITQSLFVPRGGVAAVVSFELRTPGRLVTLCLRPLLSGRDYHALHRANDAFRFETTRDNERLRWNPYEGVPPVIVRTNGHYTHDPQWYWNFMYREERDRGLDCVEDLASPGIFSWNLSAGEAIWVVAMEGGEPVEFAGHTTTADAVRRIRASERRRRRRFPSKLARAADAYVVRRGSGSTIVAGYPWFTDWGRDTFIALRGLCLATGRFAVARNILLQWAKSISEGMLPNRYSDAGEAPEFNSVDASLWYIIAAHTFLEFTRVHGRRVTHRDRRALRAAIDEILVGYSGGTRYGIHADGDGLLAAGVPGQQLTWMDAKVGDWVVTPRVGKPVEVQALWLNALWMAGAWDQRWRQAFETGKRAFADRFWDASRGYLYDVVDVDHEAGRVDPTFRPNQILAVGGLPQVLLDSQRGRQIVDAVESRLWTPLGVRSLAPDEPGYASHYVGDVSARDAAYHQGTAWPWLAGPFVDAWVRVRGGTREAMHAARERFLTPLLAHLDEAGIGHVSEIADGEFPHVPRGCPFQAWSVGELSWLDQTVLARRPGRDTRAPARRPRRQRART